jgi:hypothetical protein
MPAWDQANLACAWAGARHRTDCLHETEYRDRVVLEDQLAYFRLESGDLEIRDSSVGRDQREI